MKTKNNNAFFLLFVLSLVLLVAVGFAFFAIGKIYYNMPVVSTEKSNDKIKHTIIVDAGHGGRDSGASFDGIYEKDLTLSISQKISDFLAMYDVDVKMTRSDDKLLCEDSSKHKKRDDLFSRFKFASSFENPIFVSIHINKFSDSKYKGLQVFHSVNDPLSESLALLLQTNTKELVQNENDRKIKRATSSIYLLDRLHCPAVLIECGFISNAEERTLLTDDAYQNILAFTIANSIIEFINI